MEKIIKPKDFAKKLGVTTRTLRNWDRNGKLIAHRMPSGRLFYTESQLIKILKGSKR